MPIFEYLCQNCDKEFERLVFRSDETVECPECGQQSVNKLMSACAANIFPQGPKPANPQEIEKSKKGTKCRP